MKSIKESQENFNGDYSSLVYKINNEKSKVPSLTTKKQHHRQWQQLQLKQYQTQKQQLHLQQFQKEQLVTHLA